MPSFFYPNLLTLISISNIIIGSLLLAQYIVGVKLIYIYILCLQYFERPLLLIYVRE